MQYCDANIIKKTNVLVDFHLKKIPHQYLGQGDKEDPKKKLPQR